MVKVYPSSLLEIEDAYGGYTGGKPCTDLHLEKKRKRNATTSSKSLPHCDKAVRKQNLVYCRDFCCTSVSCVGFKMGVGLWSKGRETLDIYRFSLPPHHRAPGARWRGGKEAL